MLGVLKKRVSAEHTISGLGGIILLVFCFYSLSYLNTLENTTQSSSQISSTHIISPRSIHLHYIEPPLAHNLPVIYQETPKVYDLNVSTFTPLKPYPYYFPTHFFHIFHHRNSEIP